CPTTRQTNSEPSWPGPHTGTGGCRAIRGEPKKQDEEREEQQGEEQGGGREEKEQQQPPKPPNQRTSTHRREAPTKTKPRTPTQAVEHGAKPLGSERASASFLLNM